MAFFRANISSALKAPLEFQTRRINLVDLHLHLVASFQLLVVVQQLNGDGGRDTWVDAQNLVLVLVLLFAVRFNRAGDVAVLASLREKGREK